MDLALLPALVAALGVVVVVVGLGALLAVALRDRRRTQADLRSSRAELTELRARVDELLIDPDASTTSPDRAARGGHEYLITSLSTDTEQHPGPARRGSSGSQAHRVSGPDFVSVAVEESVVRIVSVAYGVRRALSAENRNRIRFEMRREVKRSRRQRRRDLKEARRHLRAQQAVGEPPDLQARPAEDAA